MFAANQCFESFVASSEYPEMADMNLISLEGLGFGGLKTLKTNVLKLQYKSF